MSPLVWRRSLTWRVIFAALLAGLPIHFLSPSAPVVAQEAHVQDILIQPGDTWLALSLRYGLEPPEMLGMSGTINSSLQPSIGSTLQLGDLGPLRPGKLLRPSSGGMLQTAIGLGRSPWALAMQNNQSGPFQPLLYKPLFIPGGEIPPREWPIGTSQLTVSPVPANAGEILTLDGNLQTTATIRVSLGGRQWAFAATGNRFLAIDGSGAWTQPGSHLLTIEQPGEPTWSQPWLMAERAWTYEDLTFAGTAAAIDQEAIVDERERLQTLWSQITPRPLWQTPFILPLEDFVERTSRFGARRSYGGGPYTGFHEGTDYSAYKGTKVRAPAAGIIVIAEPLAVRGGAVIINHGLGIYSGYYHLSAIDVVAGQDVQQGAYLGEVGSTGRSTGNHLHWDLVANGVNVDAEAWLNSGSDSKILKLWRNFENVR